MAFQFHLPDIGEGVVEGEIVAWKVKVGDKVKLDQPIVEIMTDKATVEIPSPRAGTIAKINYKDGEICPVGKVLLEIEEEGAQPAAAKPGNGHGHEAPRTRSHSGGCARPMRRVRRIPTSPMTIAPTRRRRRISPLESSSGSTVS